ncbi:MAG: hypothetical protein M3Z06_16555 [Actinomycetota bacterium]|nr:hypothetical protein [Actinomycetota bacterium]
MPDSARLFRSSARYFDKRGPISWDMAMTGTPTNWRPAVKAGDVLRISATYETRRASWYESMGIMVVWEAYSDGDRRRPLHPRAEPERARHPRPSAREQTTTAARCRSPSTSASSRLQEEPGGYHPLPLPPRRFHRARRQPLHPDRAAGSLDTPAIGRLSWNTPKSLPPGTYTFYCRIHPFMRGVFRIVS